MRERLWQVGFMLLLMAGFMLGGLVAQDNTPAKVLRAQRFELLDSSSRITATMCNDSAGNPSITLYDKTGKVIWCAPPPSNSASAQSSKTEPAQTQQSQAPGLGLTVYGCKISQKLARTGSRITDLNKLEYVGKSATGYIRNDSTNLYKTVQVMVNYLDYRGAQIGNGRAATYNLAPGSVWSFDIPIILPDDLKGTSARSFQVTDIQAH